MLLSLAAGQAVEAGTFVVVSFAARTIAAADAFTAGIRSVVSVATLADSAQVQGAASGSAAGASIGASIAGSSVGGVVQRQIGGQARRRFVSTELPALANADIVFANYAIVADDYTRAPIVGPATAPQVAAALGQGIGRAGAAIGEFGGELAGGLGSGVAAGLGIPSWVLIALLAVAGIIALAIGAKTLKGALR